MLACLNMAPVSPTCVPIGVRSTAGRAGWVRALGIAVAFGLALAGCAHAPDRPRPGKLEAIVSHDGVQLLEAGKPVLFYRRVPAPGRETWRMHYVHPLHSVAGAMVTEDAPADHIHHRGIFWAWRRILVDGERVADGWVGDRLVLQSDAPGVQHLDDGSVRIDVRVTWLVPLAGRPVPIVEENSAIRAYPVAGGQRRIDVTVALRALRRGVELAGTDDDKGYGGLSMRFAHPQLAVIESDGRRLQATTASMETGPDVAFLWPTLAAPWPGRIVASCTVDGRPWTRWVLRQEPSMQNCAFPGARPIPVPSSGSLELGTTLYLR